jgi:hypothetical protein
MCVWALGDSPNPPTTQFAKPTAPARAKRERTQPRITRRDEVPMSPLFHVTPFSGNEPIGTPESLSGDRQHFYIGASVVISRYPGSCDLCRGRTHASPASSVAARLRERFIISHRTACSCVPKEAADALRRSSSWRPVSILSDRQLLASGIRCALTNSLRTHRSCTPTAAPIDS